MSSSDGNPKSGTRKCKVGAGVLEQRSLAQASQPNYLVRLADLQNFAQGGLETVEGLGHLDFYVHEVAAARPRFAALNLRVVEILDSAFYAPDPVDDISRDAIALASSNSLLIIGVEDRSINKFEQVVFNFVELWLAEQLCDSNPILALPRHSAPGFTSESVDPVFSSSV